MTREISRAIQGSQQIIWWEHDVSIESNSMAFIIKILIHALIL